MKQLRRLDLAPTDAYAKLQRGALRYAALTKEEFRVLERERPEFVVMQGQAALVCQPRRHRLDLHYTFADREAFTRLFPALFDRIARAVTPDEAPMGFRFRLTERSQRPYVESVLFAHAFELTREWMEMALARLPEAGPPADDVAPGFLLRSIGPDDVPAIVQLEEVVFPDPALTIDLGREALRTALVYRVLEATQTRALAGSLLLELRPPATGYISTLAVHPNYQRRGLGEAMVRWALAWFRSQRLRRAVLTVNIDNAPAIALYRKLGFAPGEIGLDYRRPVDEDEVRQVLEKRRTEHITVRRRF